MKKSTGILIAAAGAIAALVIVVVLTRIDASRVDRLLGDIRNVLSRLRIQ